MPKEAVNRYILDCMIDEIIFTNEIEGVISTRKEVELALDALRKHDKRKRFQGIVAKYISLVAEETTLLRTLEDVSALYDDLVLDEAVSDNPANLPDGKLFRAKSVSVINAAQRKIHESSMSERQICDELAKGLAVYNDKSIEPLVRAALFHFIFAHIHPFYDGNGRMNRFISSELVCNEFSRWAGIRPSFSVKDNIESYYGAFQLAERPLNRGYLKPFAIAFMEIVLDALEKTNGSLFEKNQVTMDVRERLRNKYGSNPLMDVDGVGCALLQGTFLLHMGLPWRR